MSTTAVALRDEDFGALEQSRFMPVMSIQSAVQRRDVIVQAVKHLMKDGQDFGTIPGTPKPTLYQPGADKLNNLFGLVPRFIINEKHEDWTGEKHGGEPFFAYTVTCQLFRGDYLMGEGSGSCNSWESKYRYRKAERVCPSCGQAAIIKGKQEYGGGWLCFAKKGGCGAKFRAGDESIEGQETGRVANPDIFDLVNTVLKMANKRGKIAATLNATSAHEFFTQDIEDIAQMQADAERIDTGGHPVGTQAAANHVAQEKIRQMQRPPARGTEPPMGDPPPAVPEQSQPSTLDQILSTFAKPANIRPAFSQMAEVLDPAVYDAIMIEGGLGPGEQWTRNKALKTFPVLWAAYHRQMEETQAVDAEVVG